MSYYERELQRIVNKAQTNPDEIASFQFKTDSESTKWLNLNLESIEILRAFADIMQEILDERKKGEL
jgi:hypothetical protein